MHFIWWVYLSHLVSYWSAAAAAALFIDSSQWDWSCAKQVWSNHTVYTAPFVLLASLYWRHSYLGIGHGWWQLPACVLLTDILFYYPHRAMHSRWLYHLHKQHHVWKKPMGVAAMYAHPFEHVVVNVAPPFFAAVLLKCHPTVFVAWVAIASANTVLAHAQEGQHTGHHRHWNKNFGVGLMLCDRLHGTLITSTSSSPYVPLRQASLRGGEAE